MKGHVLEGRRSWIAVASVAALCVSAVVAAGSAVSYFGLRSKLSVSSRSASTREDGSPAEKAAVEKPKYEKINKNNVFLSNRAPAGPSVVLSGFWEDGVLLAQGDDVQKARVGETVFEVKVLSFDENSVDVEWKEKTFHWVLFPDMPGAGSPGGPPPGPPSPGAPAQVSGPVSKNGPAPESGSEGSGRRGDVRGGRGMSREDRERLRERLSQMSPEEREKAIQEFRQRRENR